MSKIIINPKFNIGDYVYHATPESPKGIIIDWTFEARKQTISYLVAWSNENQTWCYADELSEVKMF